MTDALKVLTENTAKYMGGTMLSMRYVDLFTPKDTRTGEQIAAEVITKAGLVVK